MKTTTMTTTTATMETTKTTTEIIDRLFVKVKNGDKQKLRRKS
jgi:hypothetical protein